MKKENKILALKDIVDTSEKPNDIFKVIQKSEAPYCGNVVKQLYGSDLFYYCIYHSQVEPSVEQINTYLENAFSFI